MTDDDTIDDAKELVPTAAAMPAPSSAPVVKTMPLGRAGTTPQRMDNLENYRIDSVLGRGGMGEVVLASDLTIGREVAIKRMLGRMSSSMTSVDRFLREARIQARLEHPAIVPVHEIGVDAAGNPYFTMKRVTGRTLSDALADAEPPSRQRLLRAFADVALAIEFAHSRSVVHRDLKPANIMLGRWAGQAARGHADVARFHRHAVRGERRAVRPRCRDRA